jgi:hypothetical protein
MPVSLSRNVAMVGIVTLLVGCAGFNERIRIAEEQRAANACTASGYTPSNPTTHSQCITNTVAMWRAQGQAEAQDAFLGGAMLAATALSADGNSVVSPSHGGRIAPLVAQTTNQWQRQCGYQTEAGIVAVSMALSQPCPSTYLY